MPKINILNITNDSLSKTDKIDLIMCFLSFKRFLDF